MRKKVSYILVSYPTNRFLKWREMALRTCQKTQSSVSHQPWEVVSAVQCNVFRCSPKISYHLVVPGYSYILMKSLRLQNCKIWKRQTGKIWKHLVVKTARQISNGTQCQITRPLTRSSNDASQHLGLQRTSQYWIKSTKKENTRIKLTSPTRFSALRVSGYFPYKSSFSATSSWLLVGFVSGWCRILVAGVVISSTLRFSTLNTAAIRIWWIVGPGAEIERWKRGQYTFQIHAVAFHASPSATNCISKSRFTIPHINFPSTCLYSLETFS